MLVTKQHIGFCLQPCSAHKKTPLTIGRCSYRAHAQKITPNPPAVVIHSAHTSVPHAGKSLECHLLHVQHHWSSLRFKTQLRTLPKKKPSRMYVIHFAIFIGLPSMTPNRWRVLLEVNTLQPLEHVYTLSFRTKSTTMKILMWYSDV